MLNAQEQIAAAIEDLHCAIGFINGNHLGLILGSLKAAREIIDLTIKQFERENY